ncbi:MAG: hypothetical protein AAFP02_13140, partial [Bacteroidota bacterium]
KSSDRNSAIRGIKFEMRKANIDEAEWKRAWTMGEKALYGGQGIRDGDPYMVAIPAEEER